MERTLQAFAQFAKAVATGKSGVFFSDYSPARGIEFYYGTGHYDLVDFSTELFPVFSVCDWRGTESYHYHFETFGDHKTSPDCDVTPDWLLTPEPLSHFKFTQPSENITQDWQAKVDQVRQSQTNGEAWVLNLAHDLVQGGLPEDKDHIRRSLLKLFYRFLRLQKSHSAMFVFTKEQIICSMSPEIFIRQRAGSILTSPIKGTGTKDYLETSIKEKSELDMVTDLLRNDLGQICQQVEVLDERFLVAEAHFYSARSLIRGRFLEALTEKNYQSLLPAGSISGAPKKRVVEIITSLEDFERGFYTGTAGVRLSPHESLWNILIRTVFVDLTTKRWSFPVGVGITAESDPVREWQETWQKAELLADLAQCN